MNDLTFVILRHVSNPNQNYWINCYNSIRKFYKNRIIIIDDNSIQKHIKNIILQNTEIIQNQFPGSGEISPYYYFYKYHWTNKIIFIHDSTILLSKFDEKKINSITDISFLWYFKDHKWDNNITISNKINNLKNKDLLLKTLQHQKWFGCFGVMSIITHDFLTKINQQFNFTNLIKYIKNREDRMDIERIFAICCYSIINKNNFFYICIHDMPFCWELNSNYNKFQSKIIRWKQKANLLKFWSGR